MSRRTPTPTPLPELERELLGAARRLEAASSPGRRRRWRHGWSLLTVAVVVAGSGVAAARVAEVGPFSYMSGGIGGDNPKLAPTSTITVQDGGPAPAWQARAYLDGLGRLCFTGGPRDPRTSPEARPTPTNPNGPPQNGVTCADSDEVAQALVDPARPGASLSAASDLDGALQGRSCKMNVRTGVCKIDESGLPRHMLVYAVRSADAPRPVVRWFSPTGRQGTPIPMTASTRRLRMPVDHSPDGLDRDEQAIVARYPRQLDLVLWAAPVALPDGVKFAQAAYSPELPPHGADDATVEMFDQDDLTALYERGKREGWTYERGISRDAPPVNVISAAQRRWIGAFSRPRTAADAVPGRLHGDRGGFSRFGYGVSRKLRVVGGGLGDVWIAPGGMPEDMGGPRANDEVCILGTPLIDQCKYGQRGWKRPFVEAASCTQGAGWPKPLKDGTLVWALTPPHATSVRLDGPGGRGQVLPAGELLALRRPPDQRVTAITWHMTGGGELRLDVPWPKSGPRCTAGAIGGQAIRKDNAGGSEESTGRPPGTK